MGCEIQSRLWGIDVSSMASMPANVSLTTVDAKPIALSSKGIRDWPCPRDANLGYLTFCVSMRQVLHNFYSSRKKKFISQGTFQLPWQKHQATGKRELSYRPYMLCDRILSFLVGRSYWPVRRFQMICLIVTEMLGHTRRLVVNGY